MKEKGLEIARRMDFRAHGEKPDTPDARLFIRASVDSTSSADIDFIRGWLMSSHDLTLSLGWTGLATLKNVRQYSRNLVMLPWVFEFFGAVAFFLCLYKYEMSLFLELSTRWLISF